VDFYSGIILRAIGIPLDMFTVMFAIGRMPGWIANYKEIHEQPKCRCLRMVIMPVHSLCISEIQTQMKWD
jgi:citrate synthase